MLWSLQLAAIARNWGSSWPTLRVQSLLAFIPQAWISSAPVRPATGARMQPVAGGGEDHRHQRDASHHDACQDDAALSLGQPPQGRVDPFEVAFERHRGHV